MTKFRDFAGAVPQTSLTRSEIQTAYLRGWPGGWRPDLTDSHQDSTMLSDILNMNWEDGFVLKQRGGFELMSTTVAGMDDAHFCLFMNVNTQASLSAQPSFTQQIYYINEDDGEVFNESLGLLLEQEFDSTGANLAYSSQSMGNWTVSNTNFYRTFSLQAVSFNELVYITGLRFGGYSATSTDETHNGSAGCSKPIKHDVEADTFVRPLPHDLDGTTSGFPSARACITTYARIFAGNVYKQGTFRYPSRVYWSDAGTSETWGTNSFIEVGVDDGQEIVQMLPYNESILIFKDYSTWVLMGTDEDTFALYQLEDTIGCQSGTGAVSIGANAYFFDDATGVWQYDGAQFTKVSTQIEDELLADINRRVNFKVVLNAVRDRLFLSIPVGAVDSGGTDDRNTRTYVYDIKLKTWTKWDFGFVPDIGVYRTDHATTSVGVTSDGKAYFGSPQGEIGVFRLEGTVDDEYLAGNEAVNAHITTAWVNPGEIGDRHRLRRLEIMSEITAAQGVITTALFRDMKDSSSWQSLTFTPAGTLNEYHYQSSAVDVNTLFTWLKVKISNDVVTKDFAVNGLGINFSTRSFKRGVRGELNQ